MEDAVNLESDSNELDQEIQQNPVMEEVQETDSLDQSPTVTEEEIEEIQNDSRELMQVRFQRMIFEINQIC